MTLYEQIVAAVAVTNLLFTLAVFNGNRGKAANAAVTDLTMRVARLEAIAEAAPAHDDLAAMYDQINATRNQVERLVGELDQINSNLRLLLTQMLQKGH